jgi:hypothetical protein
MIEELKSLLARRQSLLAAMRACLSAEHLERISRLFQPVSVPFSDDTAMWVASLLRKGHATVVCQCNVHVRRGFVEVEQTCRAGLVRPGHWRHARACRHQPDAIMSREDILKLTALSACAG